jgi:Zn-dependent protease
MDVIIRGLGWYAAFILSVTLHEAAHALAALKLGDPTAYDGGQVTLDPIPHIRREPFGMVIVPVLSFALGGWMLGWGSAPYNPQWALEHPRRSCWMSLAGPAANLILIVLMALVIRLGLLLDVFAPPESITYTQAVVPAHGQGLIGVTTFISIVFSLNLILFCFNLLPLPPLDGSALPLLFLDRTTAQRYLQALFNPSYAIIGMVIAWNVFGPIFGRIHLLASNGLYLGIAHYGY